MEERKKLMKVLKNKIIYTGNGKIDNGYVRFNQRISEVDEMRNFVPQEDDEIIDDLDELLSSQPKKKRSHMEPDDTFKVDFIDLD